jgi:hypothetical protein
MLVTPVTPKLLYCLPEPYIYTSLNSEQIISIIGADVFQL